MVETTKARELHAVVGDGTTDMEGRTAGHIEWSVGGKGLDWRTRWCMDTWWRRQTKVEWRMK